MRVELVYESGCDWTSNNRQGYQAVPIEIAPASEHGIEAVNDRLKRAARMAPIGQLLDAVAEVANLLLRNLHPGPVTPAVVPSKPDAMAEEVKSLGERGNVRFLG